MAESATALCVADFAGWREAARALLAAGVPPDAVCWNALRADTPSLFDAPAPAPALRHAGGARPLSVPASLLEMIRLASRHEAPERWALFYRILWRWSLNDRSGALAGDADGSRLHQLTREVRNEVCHLQSFVRFRERKPCEGEPECPRYVAWIAPAYPVLREVADHFARRMGRVSWIIATPDESALCDGSRIVFGEGRPEGLGCDDPNEALWATYYRSTFNPGRLNPDLMRSHMPQRFWKGLPEAAQIASLVSAAGLGQVCQMEQSAPFAGSTVETAGPTADRRASRTSAGACR